MLKSYSHASNLPPNTSVGCRRKVYLTSNACLHVCIHITNTQTCLILYFLTFLCAFCTFCAISFISVWLTGIVNTSSPLLGFCSIFTFLIERCGGLCRFFVMHMSTSCRLTLFYLQESCFKCFVSFAFCACAKSHTWCFFFGFVDRWLPNSWDPLWFPLSLWILISMYIFRSIYYALCIKAKLIWNTLGEHAQGFVYVATVDFHSYFI